MYVLINNTNGDNRLIERMPFMNASSDPALNAWISKYNANIKQSNELLSALNDEQEQAQEQEEIRHVGAGSYNAITQAWENIGNFEPELPSPETNTEEGIQHISPGSYDPLSKKWVAV